MKDAGITVTCLMSGATATNFFERADMLDTKVGSATADQRRPYSLGRRYPGRRIRSAGTMKSPPPPSWNGHICAWQPPLGQRLYSDGSNIESDHVYHR